MKYIETNEWSISSDGEIFNDDYESKEEAIEAVKVDYGVDMYIGRNVKLEFDEQDILIPDIEHELSEKLFYEVGEASEYWEIPRDIMKKFAESYEKFVIDFINKNGLQPTCYKVVDIEQIQAGEQE
jgi:hypothetical protein